MKKRQSKNNLQKSSIAKTPSQSRNENKKNSNQNDEQKEKTKRSQRIIIPKGAIDPNDTTIIEITPDLREKSLIIVSKIGNDCDERSRATSSTIPQNNSNRSYGINTKEPCTAQCCSSHHKSYSNSPESQKKVLSPCKKPTGNTDSRSCSYNEDELRCMEEIERKQLEVMQKERRIYMECSKLYSSYAARSPDTDCSNEKTILIDSAPKIYEAQATKTKTLCEVKQDNVGTENSNKKTCASPKQSERFNSHTKNSFNTSTPRSSIAYAGPPFNDSNSGNPRQSEYQDIYSSLSFYSTNSACSNMNDPNRKFSTNDCGVCSKSKNNRNESNVSEKHPCICEKFYFDKKR